MRLFTTHTFSAVLHKRLTTVAHFLCLLSLQLPPLLLPLLLLLQTWHRLWVWPADDWLFCLKSRLSFSVKLIVQLVLIWRELPGFIDTGTDPQRQRRLTERDGPRLWYGASSSAPWTDKSQWSELYKAPSTKCYKLMSHLHIHTRTDIFRKQIGNKNNVCNVLWRL